jgi:hypothetical protein
VDDEDVSGGWQHQQPALDRGGEYPVKAWPLIVLTLLGAWLTHGQKVVDAVKIDAVTADKVSVTLVKAATNKVEMIGKVAVTNAEPASYDVEWRDVFGAYFKTSVSDPSQASQAMARMNLQAKVKSPPKPRTISAVKTNLTAVAVDMEIVK